MKLEDRMREILRLKHYSLRTEETAGEAVRRGGCDAGEAVAPVAGGAGGAGGGGNAGAADDDDGRGGGDGKAAVWLWPARDEVPETTGQGRGSGRRKGGGPRG